MDSRTQGIAEVDDLLARLDSYVAATRADVEGLRREVDAFDEKMLLVALRRMEAALDGGNTPAHADDLAVRMRRIADRLAPDAATVFTGDGADWADTYGNTSGEGTDGGKE